MIINVEVSPDGKGMLVTEEPGPDDTGGGTPHDPIVISDITDATSMGASMLRSGDAQALGTALGLNSGFSTTFTTGNATDMAIQVNRILSKLAQLQLISYTAATSSELGDATVNPDDVMQEPTQEPAE